MRAPSWTAEERKRALDAFEADGIAAVMAMFPGLTERRAYERIRMAKKWKWDKKPWTTLEIARLKVLWRRGDSHDAIATQMGRTVSSIRQKARAEKLPPRRAVPYTAGQLRIIADAADNLVTALSTRLGHPPSSIQNKLVGALVKRGKRTRAKLLEVA